MASSDLYPRIFELVRQIPEGRVCTYGDIAQAVGSKGGARLVGWAMNASHSADFYVPAHRVVNRLGMLSGKHHFPSPTAMQELLESEGVKVIEDQVQNFDKLRWYPPKT